MHRQKGRINTRDMTTTIHACYTKDMITAKHASMNASCSFCHNAGTKTTHNNAETARVGRTQSKYKHRKGKGGTHSICSRVLPLDVYICCLCCSLSTLHLKGKEHDSSSTRGQRTKIASVCMHKIIQAHKTPHTIVQQSAGGTHTASTGTGIEGRDSSGMLESHGR